MDKGFDARTSGAAAADGLLFWFWQCEKADPPVPEVVHKVARENRGLLTAACGAGAPEVWPKKERWSDDLEKVNCPRCLEKK